MQMMLAVALGGAVGAVGRYLVVTRLGELLGYGFPYGTLAVNVIGSFLMGCLVEASALALPLSTEARGLILVGGLGAFTTFSTFALDVATFYERGELTGACDLHRRIGRIFDPGSCAGAETDAIFPGMRGSRA